MAHVKRRRFAVLALVALVVAGGGWMVWRRSGPAPGLGPEASLATAQVARGGFLVTVRETGTVKAKKSEYIRSKNEGQAKITSMSEEGTAVKKGDVLVELDKTELEKQVLDLENRQLQEEAELKSAETELEIQGMENEGNEQKSLLKLQTARLTLEKGELGDDPQERRKLGLDVEQAQSSYRRGKEKFDQLPPLLAEGFVTQEQVEEERMKLRSSEIQVELACAALRLYESYTCRMNRDKQRSDFRDAERELIQVQKRGSSLLGQKTAMATQKRRQLANTKKQLEKFRKQLAEMTLKAPCDGIVIYGDPRRPWDNERVRVGENVWSGFTIMTIPDLSEMQVFVRVHEGEVEKIKDGQRVLVTLEAYADRVVEGKVTKVGQVTSNEGWWSGEEAVKKFEIEVTLGNTDVKIRPGISARTEIVVGEVSEALHVPLQAVFSEEGKTFCFQGDARSNKRVDVVAGRSSDSQVEIVSGLKEGDRVLLYHPGRGAGGPAAAPPPKPKPATPAPAAAPGPAAVGS